MVLMYVLAGVVFLAITIVGILFYLVNKESKRNDPAVPITNPEEIARALGPAPIKLDLPKERLVSLPIEDVSAVPYTIDSSKRVEELEEELRVMSEKELALSKKSLDMVDRLTQENNDLKERIRKLQEEPNPDLAKAAEASEYLKQENFLLQTQLDTVRSKGDQLKQQIEELEQKLQEQIAEQSRTIDVLKKEKEDILSKRQEHSQDTILLQRQIEQLKAEKDQAEGQTAEMGLTCQKLKELNASLITTNQMLTLELNKHRAQASGLERICDNYRLQLLQKV